MVERDKGVTDRKPGPRRPFLSVWYRCCHVYGRMYRNASGTAYVGRCPRCGGPVRALIGPEGTSNRTFIAE
jgi:hypothetical protein